jgi:hypothetical protein
VLSAMPLTCIDPSVSLRRAVANCRRALEGETPLHLIGPEERMM